MHFVWLDAQRLLTLVYNRNPLQRKACSMQDCPPHERRAFGLSLPSPTHPELRLLKGRDAPREQGHKAWNAGWLLMDFLQHHRPATGARVLDIGCGWGLCGIFCARTFAARVTSTDIDPRVFPFVDLHAQFNGVCVDAKPLAFDQIDCALLGAQDLIVGADICFRHTMISPVLKLIDRALTCGVQQLLIADPGRPAFLSLGRHCVEHLNAVLSPWETAEPLVAWSGQRPSIRGYILRFGSWPPADSKHS